MIENGLFQLLATNSAITAVIPNDAVGTPQVYWNLAPKGVKTPFIVLERIATGDTYTMDGVQTLRAGLFAIHCYTDSNAGITSGYFFSRQISRAVRSVLASYKGNLPDTDSTPVLAVFIEKDKDLQYEEGSKGFVFHAYLEFRIWYSDE
jgi:hypothetical protein